MDTSTIVAIATPPGTGGIGIVKLTGSIAVKIAQTLFRTHGNAQTTVLEESHRLYYGQVVDPEDQKMIDEVLVSLMLAPHSYTREDVVEINAHSGPVALKAILDLVIKQGARLAEPGEFTRRAYLNGRIDLTQAEAVIDIINAKSSSALERAAAQIKGDLRERIESIRDALVSQQVEIEAGIDFPDDIEPIDAPDIVYNRFRQYVLAELEALIDGYESGHVLRDGLAVVIVGKPNVGKSSLVNRLIEKDRVIVTDVPGTTRDVIEETIVINGIPVVLCDTAGLHPSEDPIEAIGMEKTRERIERADVVVFVVEAGSALTAEDLSIYEQIKGKNHLVVINKIDLLDTGETEPLPAPLETLVAGRISALYNRGVGELKELLVTTGSPDYRSIDLDRVIPNLRQAQGLEKGLLAARGAAEGIRDSLPAELVAIDLREAVDALDEVLGRNTREDILSQIFSQFCIGK
ncbi:MAG: tRNA uridine-5-carboxymethylaminomethyl(34) synthesis GTPase MnmE [Desulfobacterales bacterium]